MAAGETEVVTDPRQVVVMPEEDRDLVEEVMGPAEMEKVASAVAKMVAVAALVACLPVWREGTTVAVAMAVGA